jgi:hypothetical protein
MSDEAWPTVTKSDCVSWNINKNNTWQRGTWVTIHDKAWREKRNQIRPGTEITIKNGGEEWQYVTKREKEWACVMKQKKAKNDHCSHIFYYNSAKDFYLFYWYFFNIQMTSIIKKIKCIEESDSDVA